MLTFYHVYVELTSDQFCQRHFRTRTILLFRDAFPTTCVWGRRTPASKRYETLTFFTSIGTMRGQGIIRVVVVVVVVVVLAFSLFIRILN